MPLHVWPLWGNWTRSIAWEELLRSREAAFVPLSLFDAQVDAVTFLCIPSFLSVRNLFRKQFFKALGQNYTCYSPHFVRGYNNLGYFFLSLLEKPRLSVTGPRPCRRPPDESSKNREWLSFTRAPISLGIVWASFFPLLWDGLSCSAFALLSFFVAECYDVMFAKPENMWFIRWG